VVRHRVYAMAVEIRSPDLPAFALRRRSKQKCSLGGSNQQQHVSFPGLDMLNTANDGSSRTLLIHGKVGTDDRNGLNRFKRRLNFARSLVSLRRFFDQASLNDRPQAMGDPAGQWRRQVVQNRGAGFEIRASTKGQLPARSLIENYSQGPQVAAF